jgi:PAS domain S-box-containing protein
VALDGAMLQVNSALCRFLGADAEALRQSGNESWTHVADRALEQQHLHRLFAGPEPVVQFEKRYLHATDQKPRWALVSVSLLREGGQPACWLYQVHDLTEQKRAAEQVAELAAERMLRQASEMADKSKNEFLSRASHEMRTPLNAVIGFAQLLQMEGATQDAGRTQLYGRHIHAAGQHLLAMVNDVLDLQRVAQGQLRLNMAAVTLADTVGQAREFLAGMAKGQQIEIEVRVPATLRVRADATRLLQVLLNILSNAVKYNQPGGSVSLSADLQPESRVRLEVADSGAGMTAEQMSHLFQPFDRLGQERSGIPGTGLGLLIARNLVVEMGGRLDVTSMPQTGTRVVVELAAAP